MTNKSDVSEKRIWNGILNLAPVRWLLELPVSKKIASSAIGKKLFNYEMVTYIFFGVLTTVVSVLSFWLFDLLLSNKMFVVIAGKQKDMGYLIANVVSFILAVLFAFITNKLFVFQSKDTAAKTVFRELILFTAARLLSFGVDMLWMFVTVTLCGINALLSKIIVQIIVVIMNYILSKIMVFRKPKVQDEGVQR